MNKYRKNINRHSGIYMNDEVDGWSESSEKITPETTGSSLYIEAKGDNDGEILLSINGESTVVPIGAGGQRSIDSLSITSIQILNAGSTHKYHLEIYLD